MGFSITVLGLFIVQFRTLHSDSFQLIYIKTETNLAEEDFATVKDEFGKHGRDFCGCLPQSFSGMHNPYYKHERALLQRQM